MKKIQIVLLACIVVGVGLLLTQKFWVPSIVTAILTYENGVKEHPPTTPMIPPTTMSTTTDTLGWVLSGVSAQGTQFLYPDPLPATYISAAMWSPIVVLTAGEFSCVESDRVGGFGTTTMERTIEGSLYCVSVSSEGAAGSTYTTYNYLTQQGDFLVRVAFTLRTVQCLNYDGKEQAACKTEQAEFDVDTLAHTIASSLTMQ